MPGPDHCGAAPAPHPSSGRRWLPVLVPAALAATFLATGHPARASALALVAIAAAALIATGVPVARLVERGVHAAVHALAALVLGALFLVAVIPVWAFRHLRGRRLGGPAGWRPPRPAGPAAASFALDGGSPERRLRHQLVAAIGVLVLLVGVDYGLGWGWDQRTADEEPAPTASVATRDAPSASSDAGEDGTPADPRTAQPAMASSPWAAAYFRDLQQQAFAPWPFTGSKPVDFTSPHINVDDWVRRSWTAPGTGDRPVVWLFGGSGMFGEGQRDDHTIASELARLAAADGLPITAVNYGQRGWVHWQELLLFEQQLAQADPPDVAAFYDGPNELTAAQRYGDGVPTGLDDPASSGAGPAQLSTQLLAPASDDRSLPSQLWDEYAEHSALRKLGRWTGLLPEPAGAQEGDTTTTPGTDASGRTELPPETFTSEGIADVAIGTYERGRSLTDHTAERYGVPVHHFLQPQYYDDLPVWTHVRDHWPQPMTDLTDSVSDRRDEVFIDGVHTNELGARLVAEMMWPALRPTIERWHAEHP